LPAGPSLCTIPGHQQGARCKATRSDERGLSHTPQGGTTAVNATGGTLMVDQGGSPYLTFQNEKDIVIVQPGKKNIPKALSDGHLQEVKRIA